MSTTRIELPLSERVVVRHDDGLLDRIELHAGDLVISLVVGPAGARTVTEAGAHLLAAGRRQHIPTTVTLEQREQDS
jgi:hypothetical protein